MRLEKYRPKRRSSDELPFGLYVTLALFALWFVFAAWSFGGGAYTDYLLVVASGPIVQPPPTCVAPWSSVPGNSTVSAPTVTPAST